MCGNVRHDRGDVKNFNKAILDYSINRAAIINSTYKK